MPRTVLSSTATTIFITLFAVAPAYGASGGGETNGGNSAPADVLEISTDRPGAADGSAITPTNHFVIESGFNADFGPDATQVQLADTLFRFGIHDLLEARLFTSPFGFSATSSGETETQALGNLTLGAKLGSAVGDDVAVAVLPYVSLDDATASDRVWSGGGTLIADLGTSQPVNLTLNAGLAAVDRGDGTYGPQGFGSLVGNITVTESVSSYVEAYAVAPPDREIATFFDGGVMYGVTPRFQLDAWLGLEVATTGSRFAGLGISYLL